MGFLDKTGLNHLWNRIKQYIYDNVFDPILIYETANGNPGWIRIIHVGKPPRWGQRSIIFMLSSGRVSNSADYGIIKVLSYSENDYVIFDIMSGTISPDRLKAIIDTNGDISIYLYIGDPFRPVQASVISKQGGMELINEYVGSTIPGGGQVWNFSKY